MARSVLKTSTILVGTRRGTKAYRSLQEIPADLRARLVASVSNGRGATMVIADKRGQQEYQTARQRAAHEQERLLTQRVHRPRPLLPRVRLSLTTVRLMWLLLGLLTLGGFLLFRSLQFSLKF